MSPEFTKEALQIFNESYSAEDRKRFVRERCGDDTDLLLEVESLLAAEEESQDFMEEPLLSLSDKPSSSFNVGDVIGKYRIDQALGEGGMGAVYLATREEPGFEVQAAIKLIRPGRDGEQVISRFLKEHEFLSKLDHQNIAKPFDRGTTPDGLPYLVMEYIQGEPIDRYCDLNKLSTAARLKLFRKVCEAVHFAHQNLIVHRDLKPANILVNRHGEPKLLDFGVAGMVNPSPYSTSAETLRQTSNGFLGTLKYASPEQVRNDEQLTTASDIYSLGILLYQLLTGHYPFQKWTDSFLDLVNAICEKAPEKPSTAVGLMEDVHTSDGTQTTLTPKVVSDARSDDPGHLRRSLSGDLDKIVLKALSKQPEDRYRSAQELADDIDRHLKGLPISAREPTLLYQLTKFYQRHTGSVVTGAGMLLLIITFGFVAFWLWQREQDAHEKTEQALMVSDILVELYEVQNPGQDGDRITAKSLLDEAVPYIERAIELDGQPEKQKELLRSQVPVNLPGLLEAFGWAYYGLGIYDEADRWLTEGLVRHRQETETPNQDFVTNLLRLSAVRGARERPQEARSLRDEALEILHRKETDNQRMASLLNEMGLLLLDRGDLDTAAAIFEESVAMKRRLHGNSDASLSIALTNLGKIYEALGEYQKAEAAYGESLGIKEEIYGEDAKELAVLQNNLAVLLTDLGLLEPERQQKLWSEAEKLFGKSLDARLKSNSPDHPRIARVYKNRALLLTYRGELRNAEAQLDQALEIFRAHYGEDDPAVAETLRNRAVMFVAANRPEEAESDARQAAEIFRGAFQAKDWRTADAESILGECLLALNRRQEATGLLENSLAIIEAEKGERARATWEARRRVERLRSTPEELEEGGAAGG